ncbi:MAG: divergent polysaccharide deacetylase family protein, partial [Pseudomonadota bacterium]
GRAPNVPAPVQEGAPQTFRDVDAPMAADADIAAAPEQDSTAVDPGQSADAAGASPSEQNGTGTSLVVEATPPSNKPPFVLADAIAPFRNGDFLHPTDTAGPITLVEDPIQAPRRIQEAPVAEPKPERAPIVPRRLVLDSDRAAQEEAAAAEQAAKTAKIVVNAVPFENPDALPLFGIVLIDDGNGDVTRGNLLSFDLPVTFALDPTRPGAVEAAKAYRDAGHEVLMLADAIPANAQSVDVEVALAGALAEMPIAVGVLDRQEASLTNDRDALGGLLAPMSEAGLGLVAYKGGLNSGITRAARSGVPTTTVYRILDKEQERPTVITRYLDRATFEAAQNGHAVVVGRATTDTVTALYSWSAGRRAGTVAVAPISHILKSASAENGG